MTPVLYVASLHSSRTNILAVTHCSNNLLTDLYVFGATAPRWARASFFTKFLDHTQRRTTAGRTPLWTSDKLVADISI
jgi:hypothetical protein